jgi:hypothetical protein
MGWVVAGRVVVAASVVVDAAVLAVATVGKGCAWLWSSVGDEQAASTRAPKTTGQAGTQVGCL